MTQAQKSPKEVKANISGLYAKIEKASSVGEINNLNKAIEGAVNQARGTKLLNWARGLRAAKNERIDKLKLEPKEFTKPVSQETETGMGKTYTMVFTTVELYGKKEAARLAKIDKERETRLARMTPKEKAEHFAEQERAIQMATGGKAELPKRAEYREKMQTQIENWLSKDVEYLGLKREAERHEESAEAASKSAKPRGSMNVLDSLFFHRYSGIETRGKMMSLMEKKQAQFMKENSSNPSLVEAYTEELQARKDKNYRNVAFPFSDTEKKIMKITNYNYHERKREEQERKLRAETRVRGKNRLQEEMKRNLLKKAEDLLDSLGEPTTEEKETMETIRGAAKDPTIDTTKMLTLMLGGEVTEGERGEIELALLAQTVDSLETRVARVGKIPDKLARAETRGKKEKEV